MANVRIKDLTTTAATTASDDFFGVDGTTNGTRKLDAYSPTFGGNLTVSGGTIGTAASTNLTLAGGSSGASLALGQGTTGTFTFTLPSISAGSTTWVSAGAVGIGIDLKRATATATLGGTLASLNGYNGATRSTIFEFNGDGATDSGRFDWWVKPTAGSLTQAMVLKSNGNLLIGTTTDGGQKLQVAGDAIIGVQSGGTSSTLSLNTGGSNRATITADASYLTINSITSNPMRLQTNGTTALTLDSSQNATFAGKVTVNGTDGLLVNKSASLSLLTMGDGIAGSYSRFNMRTGSAKYAWSIAAQDLVDNALTIAPSTAVGGTTFTTPVLTVAQSGAVTVSGAIAIGNTVNTVSPTSPNRTITMVIGGTTYYIHAKTTND